MSNLFYPEFLDFMIECEALLFGDFTLKSGRRSPYFINTGKYETGNHLSKLGDFYAKLIHNSVRPPEKAGNVYEKLEASQREAIKKNIGFNVLFGPAYKGIPLATVTAAKLALDDIELNVSFDRKERKDHGEGNFIMGYYPQDNDRIAIIDDVTTAGTSVREIVALLKKQNIKAKVVALYIAVDRMEKGIKDISAVTEIKQEFGIDVYAIATVNDIIEYLEKTPENCRPVKDSDIHAANIRDYLKQYGAE